jgi:hypothetical protein
MTGICVLRRKSVETSSPIILLEHYEEHVWNKSMAVCCHVCNRLLFLQHNKVVGTAELYYLLPMWQRSKHIGFAKEGDFSERNCC